VLPILTDRRLAELAGETVDGSDAVGTDDPAGDGTTGDDGAGGDSAGDDGAVGVEENALEESLGWNWEERTPTLLWGAGALAVIAVALAAGRRWRRWAVYTAAAPVFIVALFFCFVHLDRMLPAL
jgi:hypothetical protein